MVRKIPNGEFHSDWPFIPFAQQPQVKQMAVKDCHIFHSDISFENCELSFKKFSASFPEVLFIF